MLPESMPEGACGQSAGSARTLIVEDDYISRTVLARLLRASGFETCSASTIADAVAKLDQAEDGRAQCPTHLILDLMLPDGLGTTILRRIREHNLPIHVAVATATNDPRLLNEVRDLGADAMFPKPLDLPRLMQWLAIL